MSVAGYLSAGKPELRMTKKGGDALGIRFAGAVVTGEKTVDEQLKEHIVSHTVPEHECYESVEDYDPVLQAHCRL
jgi:hypothetical protein